MKAKSILLYQFGNKAAIRDVAESKFTLVVAVILVLCTAIARNYDQTYWRETPMFLLGPLVFSFFSGSFLSLVYFNSLRPEAKEKMPWWRDYLSFMGLFWMTAPIAWLYALPAERMFEPMGAARMNITLLAVVSIWRVWLITRVLAVLTGGGFWSVLVRVLIVAALEVLGVAFFGMASAQSIASSMSGMRNSPEENLLLSVMFRVFVASLLSLPILVLLALAFVKVPSETRGLPAQHESRIPFLVLGLVVTFWLITAIGPQAELARNAKVEELVQNGKYREAVEFLSRHSPEDFAPAKRLPPDPYDYPLFEKLPGLISELNGTEGEWVRYHYLGYLDISFYHRFPKTFELEHWATILQSLDQLPGGPEWIEDNREELAKRLSVSDSRSLTNENSVVKLEALREKYNIEYSKE